MKKRKEAKAGKEKAKRAKAVSTAHLFPGLKHIDDKTAVFAFLALLVVIIFLFDALSDQKAFFHGTKAIKATKEALTKEMAESQVLSKLIIESKAQDGTGFIVKDTLDPELLEHFSSKGYEQLKKELRIDADFAIHFEDENGNIVQIGDKICIGSENVNIQGTPCS